MSVRVGGSQGPEAVPPSSVALERERLRQAAASDTTPADEHKAEGELAEEKHADVRHAQAQDAGASRSAERRLDGSSAYSLDPPSRASFDPKSISPEALYPSSKMSQLGAASLLRFLVAISMRQAAPSSIGPGDEPGSGGDQDGRSSAQARGAVRGAQQGVRGKEGMMGGRSGPAPPAGNAGQGVSSIRGAETVLMPPTRERSMYGTPFKEMRTHVDSLHQVSGLLVLCRGLVGVGCFDWRAAGPRLERGVSPWLVLRGGVLHSRVDARD